MSSIKDNPLIAELLKLNLPADDCVVIGSGPMMARGIRESGDLELLARGTAWELAKAQGKMLLRDDGVGYVSLAGGEIEVLPKWLPGEWDTDRVIDTADLFEGIRFANLDYTLAWKRRLNREKDQRDVKLIEDYIRKEETS